MSCSPAKMAANRANASKSTGPRTAAGKEASRMNAYQHGMAGDEDRLMPGEDAGLVARRAAEFAAELGAVGPVGALLARRAGLLSVRMERAAEREAVAVAANIRAARAAWDAERIADLNARIRELDAGNVPARALAAIEAAPEGQAYLLELWRAIGAGVDAEDPAAEDRAVDWLGLDDVTPSELAARIRAEVERLGGVVAANGPLIAGLAADANRAGRLAWFDPAPEAERARRYEAAAERGMYRAMRAIADLRRARGEEPAGPPFLGRADHAAPGPTPGPPAAVSAPPSSPITPAEATPAMTPADDPLGSFRADGADLAPPLALAPVEPALVPVPARKKRPDLRKLGKNRR